jgi:uncharacterized protein YjbI with pentapeptide repeats
VAKRAAKPVVPDPLDDVRAKFIAQGTSPDIAKKAIEDATGLSRGLWISFLTFGTYLVITFAGVDHRDLLLETPIELPVLKAPLPLVTFFWVAPILFVIFHLYLLLSLKLLADQVHNYIGQMEDAGLDSEAQDRARLQLPNFVVVQVLGGTSSQINSWAGKLMRFTAWLTLIAGPLILLLFAQLMFLPYHGWWVTMLHRVMVTVDLVMIWYFWRAIRRAPQGDLRFASISASAALVVLTFFGLMYRGENYYGPIPLLIFEVTGADTFSYLKSPTFNLLSLRNTLILRGEPLVGDELFTKLDDRNAERNQQAYGGDRSLTMLQGRDFRFAEFSDTDLRKANLDGVQLQGALFQNTLLQGASLVDAKMQRTVLSFVSLQGASLESAQLHGAHILFTSMQGAWLDSAWLSGATLAANLQGALLHGAHLEGAIIMGSLQGAELGNSYMQGALLENSNLQGADIGHAPMHGVNLRLANVWRSRGANKLSWPIDVSRLDFSGLSQIEYEEVVREALVGVPKSTEAAVRRRLSVVDPSLPAPEDKITWSGAIVGMDNTKDFQKQMAQSLLSVACASTGAPYVAETIISRRIWPLQHDALPLIDGLLAGCPGIEGIDGETLTRLKELKRQFTSNAKISIAR